MTRNQRIGIFIICVISLGIVYYFSYRELIFSGVVIVVLFSSMLMISFVSLFLEHWFTTPTDVISSSISILLLLTPIRLSLINLGALYWIFLSYTSLLLMTSLAALLLIDENSPAVSLKNRISLLLKHFSTYFGNGRFLYATLFFFILVSYVNTSSYAFIILGVYVLCVILIDPKKYILRLPEIVASHEQDVGEIIGVQSKNIFIAKLYSHRAQLHRFDVVDFRYAMDEDQRCFRGLIIDNYLLNEQQWIKILSSEELTHSLGGNVSQKLPITNVVYKVQTPEQPELLRRLVGVVVEGSTINTLKFEYSERNQISEGNILELRSQNKKILYQIVQATTRVELLELKNETGIVVGEATQLGIWDPLTRRFERYGWVPDINTPIFLVGDLDASAPQRGEIPIGILPGTHIPVLLDISEAVTHHIAILGITGSGKSVLARKLVRDISNTGIKVICVDFTNEYIQRFHDLAITNILQEKEKQSLFTSIDALSDELDKFANQRDKNVIRIAEDGLRTGFNKAITSYIESQQKIAVFDLPDVSNTTGILEYTKWFFRVLFDKARQAPGLGCKLCIVIEEAHTVIPEWTFLGSEDKKAQAVINSISQIALQGRKYGIGFIVVAQRTANVSKTVLTQCNSIIAFQQFDKTGADFLSNYLGEGMVGALPNLRRRQAIAVGKGLKSGVPLIFEVPEINET